MSTPRPAKKRTIRLSTILLVLFAIAITLFCVGNSERVPVWPFRVILPVYGVILISFALGIGLGWTAKTVLGARRSLAPDERLESVERNVR